jgi:hypothetical protein
MGSALSVPPKPADKVISPGHVGHDEERVEQGTASSGGTHGASVSSA